MKKLLTTASLFVVTTIAIVSFIAPRVSAQETKQSERAGIREGAKQSQKPSVLGNGQGLAEVIVLVRDLERAVDVYRDRLGFTLAPVIDTLPSGLKLIGAKFERKNYLELRSIADREKATRLRPRIVRFLEKQDGAFLVVLEVSSAKSTAVYLRTRGFKVNEESFPKFSVVSFEGTYEVPTDALPLGTTEASPTRALVFVQYAAPGEEEGRRRRLEEERRHPNTARGIKSVWIVVKDLKTATKAYESIGLRAGKKRNLPELGATGREIEAGQGVIVLLQPQNENGKAASFLADRGEGIMGVSIEVSDVTTARQLIETNTKRKFTPYAGSYGTSILLPAEMAHGVWIEMFRSTPIGRRAERGSPLTQPGTAPRNAGLSSYDFVLGKWSCNGLTPQGKVDYTFTQEISKILNGHWFEFHDASRTGSGEAFMTYDGKAWRYLSLQDSGEYGIGSSPGWTGNTQTWTGFEYSNGTRRSWGRIILKKISDHEKREDFYTPAKDGGARFVGSEVCTKID